MTTPIEPHKDGNGDDLPDSILLYDFVGRNTVRYDPVKNEFYYTSQNGQKNSYPDESDKCYGTNINGDCRKFIGELLAENNFKEFMQYAYENEDDFKLKINDDIESLMKINPTIATKILDKFGFKIVTEPSDFKPLRKYETFPSWLEHFKKDLEGKVSKKTIESIENAKNLCNYLDHLVRHVNSNPVILNHESPNKDSKPRFPLKTNFKIDEDTIMQMAENNKITRMLMRQQPLYMFPIKTIPSTMSGGGTYNTNQLKMIIHGLISELKGKGKIIRQKDIDTIDELLSALDKIGDALSTVAKKLGDYRKWIDIYPNMDEEERKMSIGSIEDCIEKFKQYTLKHEQLENGLLNLATIMGKKL